MKTITARQFRVKFPTLEEQVSVTINRDGELLTLGTWTPTVAFEAAWRAATRPAVQPASGTEPTESTPLRSGPSATAPGIRTAQAKRDAVLRRINRTGSER